MKLAIVSSHLPERDGTAAGRALFALGEGLVAARHEVEAWSWRAEPPTAGLPPWCRWSPLPHRPWWRTKARAVIRPRTDVATARWRPTCDADVVLADEPHSFPAVAGAARTALTIHFCVSLDVAARGRWRAADVQDLRAERRAVRQAGQVHVSSERIASSLTGARAVPIAYVMPEVPLPPPDDGAPVAACLADWCWPPNQRALAILMAAWPDVRARIPAARLVLAGKGLEGVGAAPGVETMGWVGRSVDVLARATLVAFPCPTSSGTKVKVLEALAHGRPVVTSEWGMEGIAGGEAAGAVVVPPARQPVAAAITSLLADPQRARALGMSGREAVLGAHSPEAAARVRVSALRQRWPELTA